MTSDFEGFSIPDFIHYIYFPILFLVLCLLHAILCICFQYMKLLMLDCENLLQLWHICEAFCSFLYGIVNR